MATITINYDARNSAIKGLIAALLKFEGVTEVRTDATGESPYDPEFVKKINRSRKSEGKKIKLEELWN